MAVVIRRASLEELPAIIKIQHSAFEIESRLYGGRPIPPMWETVDDVAADWPSTLVLVAEVDGQIVGSVRGRLDGDTCHVGRLSVHPEHQGRGVGTQLMLAVEEAFPQARRFELFTGHLSERNLRLYGRIGYVEFRREPVGDGVWLVYMQKDGTTVSASSA